MTIKSILVATDFSPQEHAALRRAWRLADAHRASVTLMYLPPAGRLGIPDDLAIIICTLASPRSGFVTGANYRVDGGQVRGLN